MHTSRSAGRLRAMLEADHRSIQRLLEAAGGDREGVDREAWDAFRARLLRHMAIEDELLFRAASAAGGGPAFDPRLALEHRAMAALVLPVPDRALVAELRGLMLDHEAREDRDGGAYARCEALLGERIDGLVDVVRTYPFPQLPATRDDASARTAEQALRLASTAA